MEIQAARKCQTPIKTGRIPVSQEPENELFGIWEDRKDTANVEQVVRDIRKDRKQVNLCHNSLALIINPINISN